MSSCGYHVEEKCKVGLLLHQIVMGVLYNIVRDKLLHQEPLTLKTAVDMCRSSEVTGQQGISANDVD